MKLLILLCFFTTSCSTLKVLEYEKEEQLRKNADFEKRVVVQEISPVTPPVTTTTDSIVSVVKEESDKKPAVPIAKKKKKAKVAAAAVESVPKKREPELEDSVGFDNHRRPIVDPFVVGEKVVHSVSYFAAEAGHLTLEVKPFIAVNNRKSYNFYMGLKTSSLFSKFYSVDDYVETYVDYENLVPHVFKLNARESGKLVQANSFFDNDKLRAQFWEKKYTKKNGEEEKNQAWDILPFSQNVFSGIFYMRVFKWEIGKKYSFRVSDDEQNITFNGTAIEKEKLDTDAGEFNAIKIKAEVVARGSYKQTGNLYLWISDDDRKIVLRLEAEIKIGRVVSEIIEYHSGL